MIFFEITGLVRFIDKGLIRQLEDAISERAGYTGNQFRNVLSGNTKISSRFFRALITSCSASSWPSNITNIFSLRSFATRTMLLSFLDGYKNTLSFVDFEYPKTFELLYELAVIDNEAELAAKEVSLLKDI